MEQLKSKFDESLKLESINKIKELNNLPDLCLLKIFDELWLTDLFSISLVCKRWYALSSIAQARRRKLILVQNFSDFRLFNKPHEFPEMADRVCNSDGTQKWVPWELDLLAKNALLVEKLNNEFTRQWIVDMFPNISSLIIIQLSHGVECLEQINAMLERYSSSLISLNLWFWYEDSGYDDLDDMIDQTKRLFQLLSELPKIRNLHLNFTAKGLNLQPKLPILTQLETFNISTHGLYADHDNNLFFNSFRDYAAYNPTLREIYYFNKMSLGNLLQLDKHISSKFLRVNISDELDNTETALNGVNLFCCRFTSLQSLCVRIDGILMKNLAKSICQLQQLKQLELSIKSVEVNENQSNEMIEYAQCESVLILTVIMMNSRSHNEPKRLHLAEIFPNVQVMCWTYICYECIDCHYNVENHLGNDELIHISQNEFGNIEQCMKLARQSLRSMRSLKWVSSFISPFSFEREYLTKDEL
ncbi:hypothetical protein RDWZM_005254 [Blomia tropicalis]|uniref:F-box domain-containing protein n=1 Tax=Blomia tropicalis TaxID=40697 RepID=A0A9Q0M5T0_BLOTA|nr:hypothetical protein RDWZM_005254 [Blomia tropicalis]